MGGGEAKAVQQERWGAGAGLDDPDPDTRLGKVDEPLLRAQPIPREDRCLGLVEAAKAFGFSPHAIPWLQPDLIRVSLY